ncbi:hypothetical protein RI054_30g121530 [Pseudoscourfieldia marina]
MTPHVLPSRDYATRKVGLLYARSGKEVPEKGWWGMNNYVLHLEKVLAEVVAQNSRDTHQQAAAGVITHMHQLHACARTRTHAHDASCSRAHATQEIP